METKNDLSFYLVNKIYSKVGSKASYKAVEIRPTKSEDKRSSLHAFLASATSIRIKLPFFFWVSNLSLWFLSYWKNNKISCLLKLRQNIFLFQRKRDPCMGQVSETELRNNTFSNSLGLDDPINSTESFSTYKLDFSHPAPRGLINL